MRRMPTALPVATAGSGADARKMQSGMRRPICAAARLELVAAATLSLGAAAIHFGVIAQHFGEYFLFGAFFSIIGWFEALWSIAS